MKMEESCPKGWKTLLEKENEQFLFFPQCFFKRLVWQTGKNWGLSGKGLKRMKAFWFGCTIGINYKIKPYKITLNFPKDDCVKRS